MKILAIAEQDQQVALESVVETIALEASGFSGLFNRVQDLVPALMASAKNFFAGNDDKPDLQPLYINETVLNRCFDKSSFSDIRSLTHPVPAGFEGNLFEYTQLMQQQISYINEVPARITAFNQYVSSLISTAQERKNIKSFANTYRSMAQSRNILQQGHRAFFPNQASRVAALPYGDVIASNSQYIQFSKEVQSLVAQANKSSFKDTQKLVGDCKEIIAALSAAASSGQLSDMSSASMDTLAAYTECVAHEVEMYSAVLFATAQLRKCVVEGNAKLITALRY